MNDMVVETNTLHPFRQELLDQKQKEAEALQSQGAYAGSKMGKILQQMQNGQRN